ncbi:MAG: endonuclease III domain-containing protein [Desulfovibrionaceae bacterium]|nr:endonuclease III domain-containing protein [Desulfovibrionaceae bacterium]MBO4793011.1 endonuclease III domain-containing protein [Deltaproteobacteria bacterium]
MKTRSPLGGQRLMEIYQQLHEALGPSHWWPAESPLEVIIGAVLAQNTAWSNAEKAIAVLASNNLIPKPSEAEGSAVSPQEAGKALLETPEEALGELIRPAGFFRQKARRLHAVLSFFEESCAFDVPELANSRRHSTSELRASLLRLEGVGPETADSILLYALKRPSFVVDACTMRILGRHSLLPSAPTYENVRRMLMDSLPQETALYNEFHALFVRAAKEWCRKKAPLCSACPLGKKLWAWQNTFELPGMNIQLTPLF